MKTCKACKGKGWLIIEGPELQRCDACKKFKGDLHAALAFFHSGANHEGTPYTLEAVRIAARLKPEIR